MDHPQQRNRNQDAGPSLVTSPYNFAPLPDKVVFPEWAERVSQDLPFRDGISGSIEIELEAKTPLYVRSGEETVDANGDSKPSDEFFALGKDGEYAIPGTSLKGVIRSALSILTFGKLGNVHDSRFSFRDLSNAKNHYLKYFQGKKGQSGAGWLREEGDKWVLYPTAMARVRQSDVERQMQLHGFERKVSSSTAEEKYKLFDSKFNSRRVFFAPGKDKAGNILAEDLEPVNGRPKAPEGKRSGDLVFTGNPNRTKKKDFLFGAFSPNGGKIELDGDIVEQFIQGHEDNGEPVESWKYWRPKFRKGEAVPVFMIKDEQGYPVSFGLSMLYRLPYRNSVGELLGDKRSENDSPNLDFAETLFGRVDEGSEDRFSMKGRIAFEPLQAEEGTQPSSTIVKTVLGNPKPSFFPSYLDQTANDDGASSGKLLGKTSDYKTYDDDANLRGWKRYPVRSDDHQPKPPPPTTEKVGTSFRPLPEGTKFRGRIRIHNLRPVELGALLWTLTWGGEENLRHSVGMAKPFGYGSIKISLAEGTLQNLRTNDASSASSLREYLSAFESYMTSPEKAGSSWKSSRTMKELLAMADSSNVAPEELLAYPKLEMDGPNQFHDHKNKGRYLLPYSLLNQRRA